MPETNVLYSVTAAVVVGLVAWVAVVLAKAKEPWARPGVSQPKPARVPDVAVEGEAAEPEPKAEIAGTKAEPEPEPEPKADEPAPGEEKTAEK